MKTQEEVLKKVSRLSPDLQMKLSQVLSSSPSSYQIQSGSVVLIVRQNQSADIYFCDSYFTNLKNYLAIEGIRSINEIKVKYNEYQNEVILIYYLANTLNFYKGKIPLQQNARARSTLVNSQTASIKYDKDEQILSISNIYYAPNIGTHCLIVTKASKIYLLQYNQQRNVLSILDGGNSFQRRMGGLLRSIFRPVMLENATYQKSKTMMYPFGDEDLYTLTLLDYTLHMKYFNLMAVSPAQNNNSCRELSSWQVDLKEIVSKQSQIINSIFVASKGYENKHKITLLLIVCENGSEINMYEILIDLNTQIQKQAVLTRDIFKLAGDSYYHQQNVAQVWNRDTDYIDLVKFNQKIYAVYHYLPNNSYAMSSKRKHHVVVLSREETNYTICNSVILNIFEELKLVKIQKPRSLTKNNQIQIEQTPKLLLVGEDNCYDLEGLQQANQPSQYQQSVHSEKNVRQLSRQRSIPPIPAYEDQRNGFANHEMNEQPFRQSRFNFPTQQNRQYQNPFSTQKVERYISRRNFKELFNLLNLQKQRFQELDRQGDLEVRTQITRQFTDQLICLVLLKLFLPKTGLTHQLNFDLVGQIFNQGIYTNFFSNNSEKFEDFLRELFINKNPQRLSQVLFLFFKIKKYRQLYNICVETIPNYLKKKLGNQKQSQMTQQMEQNSNYVETVKNIKNEVAQNYLNLYETLITKIVGLENHSNKIQPAFLNGIVVDIRNELSQYQQKQLFDKYLLVRNLTKTDKKRQSQMLTQIFAQYSKQLKHRKFLIQMSIRHCNITLFDLLLSKRMVGKQDIEKFVKQCGSNQNTQHMQRLILNFINKQIQHITKLHEEAQKRKGTVPEDQCLSCLLWIPSIYSNLVYEHLLSSFPKIGIIYGLTVHHRKKIVADLQQRTYILNQFNDPNLVIEIIQPLYFCAKSPDIKLSVDIAKILSTLKRKFITASSILKNQIALQSIQISLSSWENLQNKIRKYLRNQEIQKVKSIFKINPA